MSFSKASRDVVPLQGTETAKMPDYEKWHDARTSSKESVGSKQPSVGMRNRPGLPADVPLKKDESFHRVSRLSAQSLDKHNKIHDGAESGVFSYTSSGKHPLEVPSGRVMKSATPIPEAEKITTRNIDKEEHMQIRRSNVQERRINRMQGSGFTNDHFLGKHA